MLRDQSHTRIFNKNHRILRNPGRTEQVDFHEGFDSLIIEMQEIEMLDYEASLSLDCLDGNKYFLLMKNLSPYIIGDKIYKRVEVKPNTHQEQEQERGGNKFLGALVLKNNLGPLRRISFWWIPKRYLLLLN
jgi:hypothetical protein